MGCSDNRDSILRILGIYKDSNGYWVAQIQIGVYDNGKRNWEGRVKEDSAVLVNGEGVIANEPPSDDYLEKCRELGKALAE